MRTCALTRAFSLASTIRVKRIKDQPWADPSQLVDFCFLEENAKLANRDIVYCAIKSCAERSQQPSPVGEGYTLFSPHAGGSNAHATDPWGAKVVEPSGGGRDTPNPLHLLSRASSGGGTGSDAVQRVVAAPQPRTAAVALSPSSAAEGRFEPVDQRFSEPLQQHATAVTPPPPSPAAAAPVEFFDADTQVLVEMRVDADGHPYTKDRFVEHYGGESEWDEAANAEEHAATEEAWHDDWEEAF